VTCSNGVCAGPDNSNVGKVCTTRKFYRSVFCIVTTILTLVLFVVVLASDCATRECRLLFQ
jgi:hypothetical protein